MDVDSLLESYILRKKFESEMIAVSLASLYVGGTPSVSLSDGRQAKVVSPSQGLAKMGIRIK